MKGLTVTVEDEYRKYLREMGIGNEEMLAKSQRKQLKHCFYAGYGQSLLSMRDHISELPEEVAVIKMQELLDEATEFFNVAAAEEEDNTFQ